MKEGLSNWNTKFFHHIANDYKRNNNIDNLKVQGANMDKEVDNAVSERFDRFLISEKGDTSFRNIRHIITSHIRACLSICHHLFSKLPPHMVHLYRFSSPSCHHAQWDYQSLTLMLQCGNRNTTILTSNSRIGGFEQKTMVTE